MSYKDSFLFKSTAIITLLCNLFLFLGSECVWAECLALTIPSGTPVTIRIDQDIDSKQFTAGSKVQASVVNDIVVSGQVLIRAGSPCDVNVISSKKAGIVGSPGSITISVNNVKAVDGKNVPITSAVMTEEGKSEVTTAVVITILCCILGLLIKGKEGVIKAGTQVTGYTVSQVDVNV